MTTSRRAGRGRGCPPDAADRSRRHGQRIVESSISKSRSIVASSVADTMMTYWRPDPGQSDAEVRNACVDRVDDVRADLDGEEGDAPSTAPFLQAEELGRRPTDLRRVRSRRTVHQRRRCLHQWVSTTGTVPRYLAPRMSAASWGRRRRSARPSIERGAEQADRAAHQDPQDPGDGVPSHPGTDRRGRRTHQSRRRCRRVPGSS